MEQLDKRVEWKLCWLMVPLFVVFIIFTCDICFNWELNSLSWIYPALFIGFLIPFVGFTIAYIKFKCWGLLIITLVAAIIMLLNMSNFLVDMILK